MNDPITTPAAPAGWELVERVAKHMADSIHYIEHVYEDAPALDRGPIMRNMKRWRDRLHEAITARALSGNAPDGYTLVPIILPPLAVSRIKDMLAEDYSVHDHAARPLWARLLAIIAGISVEDQDRHFAAEKGRAPAPLPSTALETTPVPLDAPPPKFNPPPAEAQPVANGVVQRHVVTKFSDGSTRVEEVSTAPSAPVGVEGFDEWFDEYTKNNYTDEMLALAAWKQALAQQPAAVDEALPHADLCRLSRVFNENSDLRLDQDRRINDWLGKRIATALAAQQGGES